MASTQLDATWHGIKAKRFSLDDVINLMHVAFARGQVSTDLLKVSSATPLETRAVVADAYLSLFARLGATWVEKNIPRVVSTALALLSSKSTAGADAPYIRVFAGSIIRRVLYPTSPYSFSFYS